jgi:high-affinity Fe2+/Pb2+ permease
MNAVVVATLAVLGVLAFALAVANQAGRGEGGFGFPGGPGLLWGVWLSALFGPD